MFRFISFNLIKSIQAFNMTSDSVKIKKNWSSKKLNERANKLYFIFISHCKKLYLHCHKINYAKLWFHGLFLLLMYLADFIFVSFLYLYLLISVFFYFFFINVIISRLPSRHCNIVLFAFYSFCVISHPL